MEIEKQDKRKKQDKQLGRRAQGKAMCKVPQRDIRQMQFKSTATGGQQSTGSHTHKAAGCSQTAAARGHYCAAQAASNSSQVFPIIRLHPKTHIPQHHWLQGEKMSVRRWEMEPTDDRQTCEGILLERWRGCYLVEVGGGAGAVRPIHTPLHLCVWGLRASLSSHPGYEPL